MGVFDANEQTEKTSDWQEWDGAKYAQYNPQITGEKGEYGYMAPNGRYYLALEKDGYKISVTPEFEVINNLVNWDLRLDRATRKQWYWNWWWTAGVGLPLIFFIWRRRRKQDEEEEERREREENTAV